jgi:hypothetical protein
MEKAGKPRGDRIAAWTVVFIAHALLGWALTRLPAPTRDAMTTDSALDLVWVAVPRVVPSASQARARSAASGLPASPSRSLPVRPEPSPPSTHEANEPAATQPLSAVFIQQALERAVREPPGSPRADPFANRIARLPGRAANTFRMRPPPSLAERVAQVGKLFGGGDDPCRSVSKSINELSQAGDSRDLQDALDYEKRFCR